MDHNIIKEICSYLNKDKHKINFLSISKQFCPIKAFMIFTTPIYNTEYNCSLFYYNSFTNIKLINYARQTDDKFDPSNQIVVHLPKNIEHLWLEKMQFYLFNTFIFMKENKVINLSCIKKLTITSVSEDHTSIIDKCTSLEHFEILSQGYISDGKKIFKSCTKLTKITFGNYYCDRGAGSMISRCTKLKYVDFGDDYNGSVSNIFDNCPELEVVRFGYKFDQPIRIYSYVGYQSIFKNCPKLRTVIFGCMFNYPVRGIFDHCPNLKIVKFGSCFNKSLEHVFDNNHKLQHLYLNKKHKLSTESIFDKINVRII